MISCAKPIATNNNRAFTLVELAIVLVIIGLLVGGVLIGRDLISASEQRALMAQIDKYNVAVNAFRDKYFSIPGDMSAAKAAQLNFTTRGGVQGQGDGNSVIEGYSNVAAGSVPTMQGAGETPLFWSDLSRAQLIDGSFTTASASISPATDVTGSGLNAYFPQAKIGSGHYVYVWSGGKGVGNTGANNNINYFGVSVVNGIYTCCFSYASTSLGMPVIQARNIDEKMDDAMPLIGKVTAQYATYSVAPLWTNIDRMDDPLTLPVAGGTSTCIDNNNVGGGAMIYSVRFNSGSGKNCALSFQFK
ncbi:MAG: type II secretion system protein [Rickettsiales bacterium]